MSAARPTRRLGRLLRLLGRAVDYELRKVAVWRTGFLVRELLRGIAPPLVMVFVFRAIYADGAATLAGYTYPEMVRYLILVATFQKVLFHNRALDLSRQIFEGTITKYLVMPFPFFVLPLARFVQVTAVQIVVAACFWLAGAMIVPELWPFPTSGAAVLRSLVLVLLGSYCTFLLYFVIHALAFWLDVVWTLLVMAYFVTSFAGGMVFPVRLMWDWLEEVFRWSFPYWSLAAAAEIWTGRLGPEDFRRGVLVLLASVVGLDLLRRWVWSRGLRRYAGSGM
jgi:ABC-type uncharacterized transport system permease subunit